jgi:hypothetical protein
MNICGKSNEIPDGDILMLGNKDSGKRIIIESIIKDYIRPQTQESKTINKSSYLIMDEIFDEFNIVEYVSLPV